MIQERVAEYRQKAQECALEAIRTTNSDDSAVWLQLADQWMKLAEGVEQDIAARRLLRLEDQYAHLPD